MATTVVPTGTVGGGGGGSGSTSTLLATYATAKPVSPADGDTASYKDSPIISQYDGASWFDSMPGLSGMQAPIPTTGWTRDAGSGGSVETAIGLRTLVAPAAGFEGYIRGAGSTSFSFVAAVSMQCTDITAAASVHIGLENASGQALVLNIYAIGTTRQIYGIRRPNGHLSASGQTILTPASDPAYGYAARFFVKMDYDAADVGDEVTYWVGLTGDDWTEVVTELEATSFASGPPTKFFHVINGGTTPATSTTYSLKETDLD